MPEVAALLSDTNETALWFCFGIMIASIRDCDHASARRGPLDSPGALRHIGRMRALWVVGSFLALTACSGDPRSYGITGPGSQPPPAAMPGPTGDDTSAIPGVPTSGSYYGPSNGPMTGGSGFWGYN